MKAKVLRALLDKEEEEYFEERTVNIEYDDLTVYRRPNSAKNTLYVLLDKLVDEEEEGIQTLCIHCPTSAIANILCDHIDDYNNYIDYYCLETNVVVCSAINIDHDIRLKTETISRDQFEKYRFFDLLRNSRSRELSFHNYENKVLRRYQTWIKEYSEKTGIYFETKLVKKDRTLYLTRK